MSRLLAKPLFDGLLFNRSGKRTRVEFLKTVSCEDASYDLYIRSGVAPENSFPQSDDDKYYLRILVDGWLIPLGMTEYSLGCYSVRKPLAEQKYGGETQREDFYNNIRENYPDSEAAQLIMEQLKKETEWEAELCKSGKYQAEYIKRILDGHIQSYTACKEETGGYPDFIGAILTNDLEHCIHLADLRRQAYDEKRRIEEENKRKLAAEAAAKAEANIAAAKYALLNGGTLTGADVLLELADRYHVSMAIRTRGWIINSFTSCELNGSFLYVRYMKKKGGRCSSRIHELIWNIQAAIKQETDPPEEECP